VIQRRRCHGVQHGQYRRIERERFLLVDFPDQSGKTPERQQQTSEPQHHSPSMLAQKSQPIARRIAHDAGGCTRGCGHRFVHEWSPTLVERQFCTELSEFLTNCRPQS
jgi:hypothetical protein